MKTEKKKRGRPPKIFTAETSGMTYEGAINFALDRQFQAELDKILADKCEDALAEDERKYLENQKENKSRTLNIRFTESEYRDIEDKCREFGYKCKSTYVRDCVKARVNIPVEKADFSVTNRLIKTIGNNINQIAIRLHSTGNFYAEDLAEVKRGVNEIWQLLLSIQSKQQSGQRYATLQTEIRPSTAYMSNLMLAGQTAEEQARTSAPSEGEEQDGQQSLHTT
jgi:ribosomal protein L9